MLLMSSASSLAVLEATLSASNLPLKHSNVLKRSSSSIFFSLRERKRDTHFTKCEREREGEGESERQKQRDQQEPTSISHLHSTQLSFLPFSLWLNNFDDRNSTHPNQTITQRPQKYTTTPQPKMHKNLAKYLSHPRYAQVLSLPQKGESLLEKKTEMLLC